MGKSVIATKDHFATKHHYHLAAGEIIFANPADESAGSVRLNAMLVTETPNIGVRHIGQIQQSLQMLFFQRIEQPDLRIVDVVVYGISYLGHMTEEEFNKEPEQLSLQPQVGEAPADAAAAIFGD